MTAHLRDTTALQRLAATLKRFEAETLEALNGVVLQVQRATRDLEALKLERATVWRKAQRLLEQASAAMATCQASGYTDEDGRYHAPDCSGEQGLWRKASEGEQQAKAALMRVEKKMQRLEEQRLVLQRQSLHTKAFMESDFAKSVGYLHSLTGVVQEYVQSSPVASSNTVSNAGAGVADAGDFTKLADAIVGAPLGVLEALAGIISPRPADPHWLPDNFPPPSAGGRWAFVPLEQIDLSDSHVQSAADFKKVSMQEMKRGWQVFYSDVLPAVQQGKGAEYFEMLDSSLGITPANGLRRVFDAFLGGQPWNEPIRLERRGAGYAVTNGYHRIFAAQQQGLVNIIASVGEK